jgi:multimeric flavodoxin WrbA
MRVLAVNGSPRKKGNTATVLGWITDELTGAGHKVTSVTIADTKLLGCVGCYKCQKKTGKLVCKFDDYAMKLFKRMEKVDLIIYASPVYCWGFTSQMKAFLDRHFALVTDYGKPDKWHSLIDGRRVALLLTAADHEGQGNTDLVTAMFERISEFTKTVHAGNLVIPNCSIPSKLGKEQKEMALQFAARIVA